MDSGYEIWVQFVREVAAGVVAVVGALAAYRWGHRRGARWNGYHECEECRRQIKVERDEERHADMMDEYVGRRKRGRKE